MVDGFQTLQGGRGVALQVTGATRVIRTNTDNPGVDREGW